MLADLLARTPRVARSLACSLACCAGLAAPLGVGAVSLGAGEAHAQPAPGGGLPADERTDSEKAIAQTQALELFSESGAVMAEIGAMNGSFIFSAEGSELLAQALNDDLTGTMQMMPSGATEDDLSTIRDSAWGSMWITRFTGSGKLKKSDATSTDFDAVFGPLTTSWIDHEAQTVFTRTPSAAFQRSQVGSAMRLLAMREFATETPFEVVRDAEAYFIEEDQDVDGIACRVILVRHKPEQVSSGSSSPTKPFSMRESRYFIGADDLVLRRVDRIGNFGMGLSLTFSMTFSDLGPAEGMTEADFEIEVPDGYQESVGSAGARAARPAQAGPRPEPAPRPEPDPGADSGAEAPRVMAPGFSVDDGSGGTVSLDAMAGEVTVLYWWGTWCIPCRDVSPLVSKMAEEYGDKINVVGMAYRERDPEQPKAYLADNGYGFQLALATDEVAKAYAIRAYPSVVVIGPDGAIELVTNKAARADVARNEQAGAMMADVRAAVDGLLGG